MATVNIGSLKFNWKGAYNGSTAYSVDDVTSYNGSSYICILASTGNLPTNTTYFQPMATKGTDGTDVGTTLTTQGDILYRDGSGLQRLGAGTSGQVLQTGGTGANPSWGTVSSDYVKLQTYSAQTASGGNYITYDFSSLFSSTYQYYKFIISGAYNSSGSGHQLRGRLNIGGATKTDGNYRQIAQYTDVHSGGGSSTYDKRWDTDHLVFTWLEDSTPAHDSNIEIMFYKPTLTNANAKLGWVGQGQDNSYMYQMHGWSMYNSVGDIQGISFFGNSSSGIGFRYATLYGIK